MLNVQGCSQRTVGILPGKLQMPMLLMCNTSDSLNVNTSVTIGFALYACPKDLIMVIQHGKDTNLTAFLTTTSSTSTPCMLGLMKVNCTCESATTFLGYISQMSPCVEIYPLEISLI